MTEPSPSDSAHSCQQAFVGLLRERGYAQVRMGDVAKRAGVSRPTLYRHYHSREELFRATLDDVFDTFYEQAEPYLTNFDDDFSLALNYLASSIAFNQAPLLKALVDSGADAIFISQLRKYFARIFGSLLRQKAGSKFDVANLDLVTSMLAGACFHSLRHWVNTGMQQDPKTVSRFLAHIFNARLVDLLVD